MNILTAENVYETLTDSLCEEYKILGIENAFAEGSHCARCISRSIMPTTDSAAAWDKPMGMQMWS